jgi:hypothetical protein
MSVSNHMHSGAAMSRSRSGACEDVGSLLTVDDQTLARMPLPMRYAAGRVPPDKTLAVVGDPTQLSSGPALSRNNELTSTTAPLYFAPGGTLGVGVVSLSIVPTSDVINLSVDTRELSATAWA